MIKKDPPVKSIVYILGRETIDQMYGAPTCPKTTLHKVGVTSKQDVYFGSKVYCSRPD